MESDRAKKVSAEMSKSFDMKSRDIVATHRAKIKEMALDSIR